MLTRSEVRQQVIQYLAQEGITKTQFAEKVGVNDRTLRRLVNSDDGVSDKVLQRINHYIQPVRFKVVGFESGKTYYAGLHKADCFRWINEQITHGTKLHSKKATHIALAEPVLVKRAS